MFQPTDLSLWAGRVDTEEAAEFSCRLHQRVQPLAGQRNALALLGFCSDEGVRRNQGRIGARNGPDRLRRALANLPWPANQPVYDAGNLLCQAQNLEQAQQALADRVSHCLAAGHLTFILGGGHEMAYGSWLGLLQALQQQELTPELPTIGIVNFDAHFDLRQDSQGASSGTPFYQIDQQCKALGIPFNYCCLGVSETANTQALFQRAATLGVNYRRDTEMTITQLEDSLQQLQRFMSDCDQIYLSIDLDVLPASVAPGVSAPAARGVNLEVLEPLISAVARSGKLKLADIAEYNPDFDIDNWTARVAARLFHLITTGALS